MALADIAARAKTPCYVYSAVRPCLRIFAPTIRAFGDLPHTVCYATREGERQPGASSGVPTVCLAEAGAGFDIVSGGELYRVRKAGGDPAKVVFSGVGKTAQEIDEGLAAGIFVFNCESEPELALVESLSHRRGVKARVALRVNPDVDAVTHAYISTGKLAHKFGVDIGEAEAVYDRARAFGSLLIEGVSCHIGSHRAMDPQPVMEALDRVLALIEKLRAKGFDIRHVDLGGGLGVAYKPADATPSIAGICVERTAKVLARACDDRAGALHRRRSGRAPDPRAVPEEDG